jgi:hypothetical protein
MSTRIILELASAIAVRVTVVAGYTDLTLRRLVDIKMGARVSKVAGGER